MTSAILHFHAHTHGVDVRLGTAAKAVRHGKDGRLVVDLADGTSREADLVVLAAGARPNVDLARDAGIAIGPRGASWSTRRCARRRPTSSPPATPSRPRTS